MYLADALDARANISHFKVWCTIMNICAIQQHCHNLNKDVTAVCYKLQPRTSPSSKENNAGLPL